MLPLAALAGFVCALALVAVLASVVTVLQQQQDCGGASASGISPAAAQQIPPALIPIYRQAARAYRLDPDGWAWLAAINRVETDFGRDLSTSSAGAIGWMQFLPSTWAVYGVDADGNGVKDPYNPGDAIFAAANYLHASGAPADWQHAVFAYNHSGAYYQQVAALEQSYTQGAGTALALAADVGAAPGAAVGLTLRGAASTYGDDPRTGYVDPLDNNRPALVGATNDIPGIAVLDARDARRLVGGARAERRHRDACSRPTTARAPPPAASSTSTPWRPGPSSATRRAARSRPAAGAGRCATSARSAPRTPRPPPRAPPPPRPPRPRLACMPCPPPAPGAAGASGVVAQVDPGAGPRRARRLRLHPGARARTTPSARSPAIAARLDALGRALGLRLTGISGYRTPAHSVAVGGFARRPAHPRRRRRTPPASRRCPRRRSSSTA